MTYLTAAHIWLDPNAGQTGGGVILNQEVAPAINATSTFEDVDLTPPTVPRDNTNIPNPGSIKVE